MLTRPAVALVLAAGLAASCVAQAPDGSRTVSLGAPERAPAPGGRGLDPRIAALGAPAVAFPQYPSISPDGRSIVFSYAGDLWSIAASGGAASRLSAHPSDEDRSAFSPSGDLIAFESERDGPRNIYTMPVTRLGADGALVGGAVRRVTVSDRAQALSGFSADGASVLFTSNHEPAIHRATRMYRAAVNGPEGGGSAMVRLTDAFGSGARQTPDGAAIVFHRGRYDSTRPGYTGAANPDIYRFDGKGGSFVRLTSDAHNDADAYPLPDGSVVFVSARDGQNNLWLLPAGATGDASARQLTRFAPSPGEATIGHGVRDLNIAPGGWAAVFCVWDTMYTLDCRSPGAQPEPVPIAAGGDFALLDFQRTNLARQVTDAALSPDGKTLAVIARGEVFTRSTEKDRPTRRITGSGTSGHARARDLAWSPDGRLLYFSSDAGGVSGIYAATVAMSREDLGEGEKPERPEPRADEPEKPKAEPGAEPAEPKSEPKDRDASEPPAEKAEEKPAEPGPGARKREKKPDHGKRWADAITFKVEPVAVSKDEQRRPIPSPDGKRLLLTRGLGELVLIDLAEGTPKQGAKERVIVSSWNDPAAQWAADSRHIVYEAMDVNYNADIWLLDTAGEGAAKPVNLTRHPDSDHSARLSADGKVLYFLSDRDAPVNGQDDVFAVNLDRRLDGLRPYELADYFKEAADKAKRRRPLGAPAASGRAGAGSGGPGARSGEGGDEKPAEEPAKKEAAPSPENPLAFDTDDAYLRIRKIVATSGDTGGLEITPGGERVIFSAATDGASSLQSVDYAGKEKKTVFAGSASNVQCSLTGEKVLFTSGGPAPREAGTPPEDRPRRGGGGEAYLGKPAGGESERLSIDAPVTVDIAAQQRQKFLEAARLMGARFYHPTLKGLDWPALTERYLSLAVQTRTDGEFNRVFQNLLGELEGSHMGISGGRETGGSGQPVGYLGVDAERAPGGYRLTRIVPHSPADSRSTRLNVGETIVAINGKPVAEGDAPPALDLNAAMAGTAGQETLLELRTAGANGAAGTRHVLIAPVSSGADSALRYRDEVRRNAALVDKLSGGKLGYLHIRAMDMGSVRDYERDVFAAADGKLGLLIDVRDNGGGSTADILLASLTAPRHAYTAARGVDLKTLPKDAYPRDRRLIYSFHRPITVLINQNSYSNAEIFAHAIKTIGRGKLVGVPTFGAVISTGSHSLIDGTTIRTPFRGWYLPDGRDMENNGAEPDIAVPQTPEDEVAGRDRQLEEAVKELLTRAKAP